MFMKINCPVSMKRIGPQEPELSQFLHNLHRPFVYFWIHVTLVSGYNELGLLMTPVWA